MDETEYYQELEGIDLTYKIFMEDINQKTEEIQNAIENEKDPRKRMELIDELIDLTRKAVDFYKENSDERLDLFKKFNDSNRKSIINRIKSILKKEEG